MNTEIQSSLLSLLERIPKPGRIATYEEVEILQQHCNGIVPIWYEELLMNYPICELEIGWQLYKPEDDYDGIVWIEWSNPEMMRSEMFDAYPGIAIYQHGYLNVASCKAGSGDPYFININEGENARLLQVFHDVSENYEVNIKEGINIVAESLSEFFKNAIVTE